MRIRHTDKRAPRKSGKQRRLEIRQKRMERAASLKVAPSMPVGARPVGSVEADHSRLDHINSYSPLPAFYVDKVFNCRDCGAQDLWTAKQQKWWYEIAKGHIDSRAVRCRKCRDKIKAEKDEQRRHMAEMAEKKPHPNEAFFKKKQARSSPVTPVE